MEGKLFAKLEFAINSEIEIGGTIDAAQLGQWVGGDDPRIRSVRDIPMKKFFEIVSGELLTLKQFNK